MARLIKTALLVLTTLTAAAAVTMPASANRGGGHGGDYYFEQNYHVDKPVKGYTGSPVGVGPVYCDYIRTPERSCKTRSDGTESCVVHGYNIKQFCRN